jgi:hypothetical protein
MDSKTYSLDQLANQLGNAAFINLDKLQLTLENADSEQKERYKRRANAKLLSLQLSKALVKLGPVQLSKQYDRGTHCSEYVLRENDRYRSKYCSNRFCLVCNRIKTADLINGYGPILNDLPDLQFITLTIPNVQGADLKKHIQKMTRNFAKIKDLIRKRGTKITGIRKLEVTYNDVRRDFHPHFHIALSGKEAAETLVNEWLNHYPSAKRAAQDIKKADSGAIKELFKYFTKITTNNKNSTAVHITALNRIFNEIKGLRVFQPFGIKKIRKEATQEEITRLMEDRAAIKEHKPFEEPKEPNAVFVWSPEIKNWVQRTGEILVPDFVPWKKNVYFYKRFNYEPDFWPNGLGKDNLGNKDPNKGFVTVCAEMDAIR